MQISLKFVCEGPIDKKSNSAIKEEKQRTCMLMLTNKYDLTQFYYTKIDTNPTQHSKQDSTERH